MLSDQHQCRVKYLTDIDANKLAVCTDLRIDELLTSEENLKSIWNGIDISKVRVLRCRLLRGLEILRSNVQFRSLREIHFDECPSTEAAIQFIETKSLFFDRNCDNFIIVKCQTNPHKTKDITSILLHYFGDQLMPLTLRIVECTI